MQTTEEQQAYDAVYRYAHEQMSRGIPDARIHQALVAQGWDANVAQAITDNLRAESMRGFAGGPPELPIDVKPAEPAKATLNYRAPTQFTPTARPRARSGGGGGKDMAIGGLICLIGLVVTIGTYAAASSSPTGGRYTVAWGAIVFGGFRFFKGLAGAGGDD